ncbi:hypothetical protein NW759_017125 [Fusarium solani]|nr:hypothetical protein NW759_017125 [Fusarium solani]
MSQQKSKAAVLVKARAPIELWKYDVPTPGPGCINVEVLRAGVCGTDAHLWEGDLEFPEPFVLGHEGLGQIIELGPGVTTDHASQPISVGDLVLWNPLRPCHSCYNCSVTGDYTSCRAGNIFSWARGSVISATYTQVANLQACNSFFRLNPEVPLDAYVALGCALPAILQGLEHLDGIPPGSTVVVQGAGPVGLAAVMMAKISGATNIVCIEGNANRLRRAGEFGATVLVDMKSHPTVEDRAKYIEQNAIGNTGVQIVIECSGHISAFEEGVYHLSQNGKYLLVGMWAGNKTVNFSPFAVVRKALTIVGSNLAKPRQYYDLTKIVEANWQRFPLEACVTHRYRLHESEKAFKAIASGEVGKAVILPQDV